MKKSDLISFVLILSVTTLMLAGCQEGEAKAADKGQPAVLVESTPKAQPETRATSVQTEGDSTAQTPNIVLKKGVHNFGEVGPGSSNIADYEFVNKGKGELVISNVQSTCGCSKPTLIKGEQRFTMPLKEPVTFEPGQMGKVEVTFRAPTTKGAVTKHLYIVSNNPSSPRSQLEIKAQISLKVTVSPESVELLLDKENAGMPDIVVESTDGKEFSITSATIPSRNGAVEVPFDSSEKSTKFTLKPIVDLEKLSSYPTGAIQIRTSHPQSGTLLVRYSAKPMYELSNPRYILQNITPGEPILRENLIRSNYGKKVEIDSVSSRNGYMELESQEQDGNHLKLAIKITPPERDSSSRRYITDEMNITLKDGTKLSIRSSGWFKAG